MSMRYDLARISTIPHALKALRNSAPGGAVPEVCLGPPGGRASYSVPRRDGLGTAIARLTFVEDLRGVAAVF
jgi:hypothetical protein